MKHVYFLSLVAAFCLLAGCSKDVLKSYDKRIQGEWKIIDVDRYGFNGEDALPFKENDRFTFSEDGKLQFVQDGKTFQGSWDIVRQEENDNAKKALRITAIDFTDQQIRSENFNEMVFTNTNRFTAFINYNTRAYVYRFLRQ